MSSLQVECWNCGLKFNVVIGRLATARCGNCQQMVAKEEQLGAEAGFVNQSPNSVQSEAQAIEIRPTAQAQEEKKILAANEPRAESSQIPQIANSARAIGKKELLLGLGLTIIVALIARAIVTYVDLYWLIDLHWEYQYNGKGYEQEFFIQNFDFNTPDATLSFIRHVIALALFFYLLLRQKYTRQGVYVIAVLTFIVALLVTEDISLIRHYPPKPSALVDYLYMFRWSHLESLVVIIVELVTMDFLTRRLFRGRAFAGVMDDSKSTQPAILEAREEAK